MKCVRRTSNCMVGGTVQLGFETVLYFLEEDNAADIKIKDENSGKRGLYYLLSVAKSSEVL
jgi:hypothetical protein